jgi:transcriptional regulator with XRE-family HTH domain
VSPTVRQRELGARLRELRDGLGLSADDAAERSRCSATRIREIEAGARRATAGEVAGLCRAYGLSQPETDALVDLSRQAREPSWWTHYEDLKLSPYIGLEHGATAITVFSMYWVPALMQTQRYAREMVKGIARQIDPTVLEYRIEARLRRQEVLDGGQPPRYRALVDEAVLHRRVGGASVMAEQLDQVLRLTRDGKATVQVIPFAAGAHASTDSNFEFLEFEDPALAPVVFVEGLYTNSYQERPEEIDRYREAIGYLGEQALSPQDSLDLIAGLQSAHAGASSP